MPYDVVVVGSGVGGMTAAIVLAKEGRRVLVVEQHGRPGGLMQVYPRGDCCFPTGVHCVGSLAEDQILWRYLKYLGVLDRVRLARLDDAGIAEYVFPEMRFVVPRGPEAFQTRLLEQFPSEEAAIRRFFDDMRQVVARFPLYHLEARAERLPPGIEAQSLKSYLDRLTDSQPLKAILTAINPLYGIDPAECPLHVHWLVLDSVLNSSWRFDQAAMPLADAFVDALGAAGGAVRCGACVDRIESSGGSVRGVRLADGERIEAQVVVFTGHPKQLPALCEEGTLRPFYKQRLTEQPETPGMFGVGIRWEEPEGSLERRDVLVYRGWDTGGQYHQRTLLDGGTPHVMICCASRKPAGNICSAVGISIVPGDDWLPWWHSRTGSRPADYLLAKEGLAQRMLAVLQTTWPQAADRMRIMDTYSPLTVRDYTMTPTASAYGLKKSVGVGRSGRFAAATRINGLFLAGQSLVLPGVVGTVISGIDACATILGRGHLLDRIARES